MEVEIKAWAYDIVSAIHEIEVFLEDAPNIGFTHARKIVETRNRIIHGYDSVSDEVIWSIVTYSLPVLKGEVEKYLGE